MRLSKALLFLLIFLLKSLSLHAQCPSVVNEIISINDFPIERNGLSTENSGDDFIVLDEGSTDPVAGYASNDYIFQFTLGYEDADSNDVENNDNAEAISIFVDMCNNGVTFDASIAIIKAQAHDNEGNPIGSGIDCSNISVEDLIITHDNDNATYPETLDAGGLCPESTSFSDQPDFLPIARDIYLEEPGIYYIVVEGHSQGDGYFGGFDLVIDRMPSFDDYPYPHDSLNTFFNIEFSNEIYSVIDNSVIDNGDTTWGIGGTLNGPGYFRAFDENGNPVGIGTLKQVGGAALLQDVGYSALRFELTDQPDQGASIFITTAEHNFIFNSMSTPAPHPVNIHGIPFSIDDTIEVELHDLVKPTINIIGDVNTTMVNPDGSFIITSSEPLLRNGVAITGESIKPYIELKYYDDDVIIDSFGVNVNADNNIIISPTDPMTQWVDVVVTLVNVDENDITITDDPEILHDNENCPGPNVIDNKTSVIRVKDIEPPTFESASVDDDTNTLVTITMSEATYSQINESGGLNKNNFELTLAENESNNLDSVKIENVIQENSIQTLTGGEMTFRLQLILYPSEASGSEEITISPTEYLIYDRAANPVANQLTVTFNDELAPSVSINPVSSGPIMPNTDFVLTFSEPIKRYQESDTSIVDLDVVSIASIINLIDQNGNPIDYDATLTSNETVITINPDDDLNELETVTLSFSASEFCDQVMNLVSSEEVEYVVADITPPVFDEVQVDDPLSRGNDHITIIISDPIYTDTSATGAVNVDDFNLDVELGDGDEVGVESISIVSIADTSGGIPVGGETILRLNLSIIGPPNGEENISVKAAPNQIYDLGGNAMSANEELGPFNLYPAPFFSQDSSILSDDNRYIRLVFKNGPVYHSQDTSLSILMQDFMVQLTNSDGDISEIEPTYISIVDEDDEVVVLFKGAHNVKFNFNDLGFIPEGDETIMIFPQSSNAIYNKDGVSMDESESVGPFILNDQLKPFYNINIADGDTNVSNNDTILLAFNEPIRLLNGEALDDASAMDNFEIWDVSRTDTIIMTTPDGNTIVPPDQPIPYNFFRTIVDGPGPDSIWVIMEEPFGSEHIMSITIKNNFEDENGNQLLDNDTISFKSRDNISPDFVSGSARIDSAVYLSVQNNPLESARKICFVNLSINDNVFTDTSLTGPVQASDFIVGIIQNGGSVTSGDIEYLELVDNGNSDHDAIRFKIRFDEVPAGSESLFISADTNSIFDSGLNFMNADSTSDTLTIYDLRFPTIDSTSIEHEGYIDLMSDSTILVYFSEPIVTNSFSYELKSKFDVSGFNHAVSLSPDSLTILLDSTIMSYDTLELNIVSIEDTSGNQRDSLLLRRFFTKAAGDFSMPPDDRVSLEDLREFRLAWNSGDYSKNLGPYAGTPPNIKITQDSLFGIDDGMVFIQMWLWSLQGFGPTEITQQPSNDLPSSIFMSNNLINILPPHEATSGQIKIEYDHLVYSIIPGENSAIKNDGILLSNYNDLIGLSILEYSTTKNKNNALGFIINKHGQKDSEIRINYSFFDDNFMLISKGDSIIHEYTMPTEFSLMQNYPNPFNPSTNIRFTIPKDSYVKLYVYDINGKIVDEIINGYLNPGVHNVEWRGTDIYGREVSSGVYFYSIEAPEYSKSYKMVFVK